MKELSARYIAISIGQFIDIFTHLRQTNPRGQLLIIPKHGVAHCRLKRVIMVQDFAITIPAIPFNQKVLIGNYSGVETD